MTPSQAEEAHGIRRKLARLEFERSLAEILIEKRFLTSTLVEGLFRALSEAHVRCPACRQAIPAGPYLDLPRFKCPSCGGAVDDLAALEPVDVAAEPVQEGCGTPDGLIEQTVAGYRLEAILGRGAMATVYRATRLEDGRVVALKLLSPQVARQSAGLVERFRREATALRLVDHRGIVRVLAVGEEADQRFIAMELVEGETLRARIDRTGPVTPAFAADVLAQVLDALRSAHDRGLVHRDLKPENILITPDGRAKVADFGLARALAETSSVTAPGEILGTPAYMSPEQCEGRAVDRRSDLYSVGATFYHALAGRPPFDGASSLAVILKHAHDEVPDLRARNPAVPEPLASIVMKLLAKSPEARYQTAEEALSDLARTGRYAPPPSR